MNRYRKIAGASAALWAMALLGATAAGAQPLHGSKDGTPPGSRADPFTACRTVGTPISLERFLCYRRAANLANEQLPAPLTRPIVIDRAGFDLADAGVGFATATGLVLVGAGSAVAVRSRAG